MKKFYSVCKSNNLMGFTPTMYFDDKSEAEKYAVDKEYNCVWNVEELTPANEKAVEIFEKLVSFSKKRLGVEG